MGARVGCTCVEGRCSMKYFSRFLIYCGLLIFTLPAAAESGKGNGRIAGKILSVSGNPLRDAVVRIFREVEEGETLTIAKTDSRGMFRSPDLTPGVYHLQVLRHGYQPVKTGKFIVDPDRTTSFDIMLQEFLGFIYKEDDPRNWDPRTVMRSTSDRRMIFRNGKPGVVQIREHSGEAFHRGGWMSIASSTASEDVLYPVPTQMSQTGVSSNFAFAEPLSRRSRMILSGQVDYGAGSFWRLRNTYNYRPDKDHDYRLSVGYGRMNVNYPGSRISSQLLADEPSVRKSGIQTLAFGLEGNSNFMDLVSVKYGFDYSRLHYGSSRSFYYPSIEIVVNAAAGWSIKTSMSSRRVGDSGSVLLPDGEVLYVSEPTLITMYGDEISMSRIAHSEISTEKEIAPDTALELVFYQDRMQGPGLPLMVTTITPTEQQSRIVEMNEDQSRQRGVRVTIRQKLIENVDGSVSYVFGDSIGIAGVEEPVTVESLNNNLSSHLQQRNQHSITGRLAATLPRTRTKVLATLRWYSGNPLTPVDWFSDRMDIGTKSANFELRQPIPFPEFMGTAGRWEVTIDLRNLFNQGKEVLPMKDGELVLNRNPRSMRFGLSLRFE